MTCLNNLIIGFDGKRAAQNRTGLGNYSRFIVRMLSKSGAANRLLLYIPSAKRSTALDRLDAEYGVETVYSQSFTDRLLGPLWRTLGITRCLQRDGVKLYHGLSNELPLNIRRAKNVKTVVTIHDLIFRHFPKYYGFFDRHIYNYKFRKACINADRIIAVSQCTKRDIIEYYHIDPDKIDVVYQGCDERYKLRINDEQKDLVHNTYNLPSSFVLYLGTIERRKNLMLLVKALKLLPPSVSIVAVGHYTPYTDEVLDYVKQEKLNSRITIINSAPFSVLPALYQMAGVFVYPSRYEGFGIPILEALASGTPVIACKGSCLEEAGGPSSMYVDPDNEKELADTIAKVLGNHELRQKMIDDGLEYAKRFEPEKLVRDLTSVYFKALNS